VRGAAKRLAAATLILAAAACSKPAESAQSSEPDPTVTVRKTDSVVLRAREDAMRTLPMFWRKFDAQEEGASKFSVKVELSGPNGEEVVWMRVESREGEEIVGLLAVEPSRFPGLHLGSRISVHSSRVTDWSYEKGGKVYGDYFTRAMIERAPADIKAQVQATFAPTPTETSEN